MTSVARDSNRVPALLGGSSADSGDTPVIVYVDPTTHRLLVDIDAADITSVTGVTDAEAVNAADKGILSLGTDGSNYQVLATDSSGNLQVDILNSSIAVTGTFWQATQPVSLTSTTITGTVAATQSGTWNIGTLTTITNPVAVTQSGTWDEVGINDSGNSITVDYATTGSGTATGALRVELPTNGTGVIATVGAVTAITNALPAGTNAIGKLSANSGVDIGDVDVTSISAGTNLIGDVDIQPRTTGGWSVANFTSGDTYTALTNSAQVIKASAGKFGGYYIYNPNGAATYVLIYDIAAASVTVGTSTAKLVFCIPASGGANLELLAGIPFTNAGWSIAATTTGGGNTAPTTALEAMIFYK